MQGIKESSQDSQRFGIMLKKFYSGRPLCPPNYQGRREEHKYIVFEIGKKMYIARIFYTCNKLLTFTANTIATLV